MIVVGAGPSGSTLAYYLGNLGRKVLLLEKKKFPRDKYCGDAVCKTAIEILDEMGVYKELIRDNKARIVSWLVCTVCVGHNPGIHSPATEQFVLFFCINVKKLGSGAWERS